MEECAAERLHSSATAGLVISAIPLGACRNGAHWYAEHRKHVDAIIKAVR